MIGGGSRIRTYELLRGQFYRLLPLTARPPLRISKVCRWRRGGISTPEALAGLPAFEAGAFNRALPPLHIGAARFWCGRRDSNSQREYPAGFRPAASTDSATSARHVRKCFSSFAPRSQRSRTGMVGVAGFEPAAPSSQTRCATRLRYTAALRADRPSRTRLPVLATKCRGPDPL